MNTANLNGADVIIFDTAGRTQIDLPMMTELKKIKSLVKPTETILIADSTHWPNSYKCCKRI